MASAEGVAGRTVRPARPPQPAIADDKDWLWTLADQCSECGLDPSGVTVEEVADRAEAAAGEWFQILTGGWAVLTRPEPDVWSPLEYGSHVRDVFELFDARLALMLVEDKPVFEHWDQDEAAESADYGTGDPEAVADELAGFSASLVQRIRGLEASQLGRTARRADGAEFTMEQVARMLLHEVVHHLWDVTGQTDAAGSL